MLWMGLFGPTLRGIDKAERRNLRSFREWMPSHGSTNSISVSMHEQSSQAKQPRETR
jgi:hypothetical protein